MALGTFNATIVNSSGDIVPGAEIEVRRTSDNALATLFSDASRTAMTNPFNAHAVTAFAQFFAERDTYAVAASTGAGTVTWTVDVTPSSDGATYAPTRAEALLLNVPAAQGVLFVRSDMGLLDYKDDPAGTALTTAGGRTWSPYGTAYIDHWADNTSPGTTDMTTAIQAGLTYCSTVGKVLHGFSEDYLWSQRITMPSNTGLKMAKSGRIIVSAAGFNNTNPALARTGTNNLVLDMSGMSVSPFTPKENQSLENLEFVYQKTEGRVLDAVRANNCKNLKIKGVKFRDFPCGYLLRLNWLSGDWSVDDCAAYDCTNTTALVGGDAQTMQISLVTLDDNTNNISTPGVIHNIRGYNMGNSGAGATQAGGMQSDVVNIQKGLGHTIRNVHGENVSEVVDIFASRCMGGNFTGVNCEGSTLKLIHGAQHNIFFGVSGIGNEYQVLSFSEGNGGNPTQATSFNQVHGVYGENVDRNGTRSPTYGTAVVRFDGGGAGVGCTDNLVTGLVAKTGPFAKTVVLAEPDTARNTIEIIYAERGTDALISNPQVMNIKLSTPTAFSAVISATQNMPLSTNTKVRFATEVGDMRGEFSTVLHRWVAQYPGFYDIAAAVAFIGGASARIMIFKNGAEVARQDYGAVENRFLQINRRLRVLDGDYFEIYVFQESGLRDLISTAGLSEFSVYGPL